MGMEGQYFFHLNYPLMHVPLCAEDNLLVSLCDCKTLCILAKYLRKSKYCYTSSETVEP